LIIGQLPLVCGFSIMISDVLDGIWLLKDGWDFVTQVTVITVLDGVSLQR